MKGGEHIIYKGICRKTYLGNPISYSALDGKGEHIIYTQRDLTENIPGKSNQLRPRWKGGTHDIHKGILTGKHTWEIQSALGALDGKGGTHHLYTKILTENIPKSNQLTACPRWKREGTSYIHKGILAGKHTWEIQSATALDGREGTHHIHKGILTENIPGNPNQLQRLDGKGGTHHTQRDLNGKHT
ncbi:unnamed protein product [Mytilus edulis]|uniref:Uncharacterized protein n=1 Tax=Mytilus edulis TaxID=6550 RepID=A0A8S3UYF7_MYTED|nr:unnamed protein product [Mytilus edulis]